MQVLLVQYLQISPFKNKTTKFKEGREKFYTSTKLKKNTIIMWSFLETISALSVVFLTIAA